MFWIIIIAGVVLYFVLRGKKDRPEQLGAAHRPLPMGPLDAHTFPCPYPKCPACGGSGDGMKQQWDGLRSVKWTCGYCGAQAGVQELTDAELPPSARQRLGLDAPPAMQGGMPMQGGFGQGGGVGDLLTGMMIGSMMGGGHNAGPGNDSGWGDGGSGGDAGGGSSDWGDSGGSGGSDWGDSGGGDSGGGDSGGDW